ncbi:hypothetical protein DPMN_014321 [Dreissena polymorpha]|uniref:Uncharacterized protein n=1 Tax=Dreissena polymorpha TaxID=45954 RepID=A0A9D4S4K0_DREPO|nr:hypothetical protein DPMN_014321 [Dreissena polymorpha]
MITVSIPVTYDSVRNISVSMIHDFYDNKYSVSMIYDNKCDKGNIRINISIRRYDSKGKKRYDSVRNISFDYEQKISIRYDSYDNLTKDKCEYDSGMIISVSISVCMIYDSEGKKSYDGEGIISMSMIYDSVQKISISIKVIMIYDMKEIRYIKGDVCMIYIN